LFSIWEHNLNFINKKILEVKEILKK